MANKFNISQLLNNTSRQGAGETEGERKATTRHKTIKVVSISVRDLVPSKDNFYSMEGIETLKTAIELAGGVKQNLNVIPLDNGKYEVLAGHRRRLASIALIEEGKVEYEFVPCSIEEIEEDAELQEIKQELLLILTNSQRDKTDWDKMEEVKRLRITLERYKKKEKIPGRIREIIAETLNTSAAQVGRMDAIANNLSEDFKEELKAEKLNISTAYELSGLTEEKQKETFAEYEEKGSLTIKDVKRKKAEEEKQIKEFDIQMEAVKDAAKELDKINNEVTEKLKKEYEETQAKFKNIQESTNRKETTFEAMREMDLENLADFLCRIYDSVESVNFETKELCMMWLKTPSRED